MAAAQVNRAELVAQTRALRAGGLLLREIAERMGCAKSTVAQYLDDPDLSKLRARKDSYRGKCIECGGPTDGSNGRDRAPARCTACVVWTREAVLLALEDWANENGGVPPRTSDAAGSGGRIPTERTVARLFGSWNAGLLAAGFELRCDRRPETWEAILEAVRAGEPTATIAARHGVSTDAIRQRFKARGMRIADYRPAGWAAEQQRKNGYRLAEARWGAAA